MVTMSKSMTYRDTTYLNMPYTNLPVGNFIIGIFDNQHNALNYIRYVICIQFKCYKLHCMPKLNLYFFQLFVKRRNWRETILYPIKKILFLYISTILQVRQIARHIYDLQIVIYIKIKNQKGLLNCQLSTASEKLCYKDQK